jgi:DNA-binding Xre family transcriptional regulator
MVVNRITEFCQERQMTKAEFARRIGVSFSHICTTSNTPNKGFSMDMLGKLCKEFDAKVEDFLVYIPEGEVSAETQKDAPEC